VGEKLRVSVVGNRSDPTYLIETFTQGQGEHPAVSYSDGSDSRHVLGRFGGDVYIILLLKSDPQRFQVITLGAPRLGREQKIIDYTPTAPTHPSISTSVNPSFSKWMFGKGNHGVDYGGNDSKCNTCHASCMAIWIQSPQDTLRSRSIMVFASGATTVKAVLTGGS